MFSDYVSLLLVKDYFLDIFFWGGGNLNQSIVFFSGFNNSDSPCCSFGKIRPALTCIPASTLCSDRSKYLFWDEYHPSDKANELIANELIKKLGFDAVNNNTNGPSPAPAVAPSPEG